MPTPVYGLVILIVILVYLSDWVRQGMDAMTATAVIVSVTIAAADMAFRLQRRPSPSDEAPLSR
jgi:hypothetical protein